MADLGYPRRMQELAWIAGYMHDIGNVINRIDHAQSGAVMAFRILDKMGMEPAEVATVVTAITSSARIPKIKAEATTVGIRAMTTFPIRLRLEALSRICGEAVTIRRCSSICHLPAFSVFCLRYHAFASAMV